VRRVRYGLISFLILVAVVRTGLGQAPMPAEPLRTAADRPIDIEHIRLDMQVDLRKQEVAGRAVIELKSLRPTPSIALNAVELEVSKVALQNGKGEAKEQRFTNDGRMLTVDLAPAWTEGQAGVLVIDYRVRQPKAGLYFFKPTEAEPDVPYTVWSQGEPATNSHWFPCVDHPNERQTTELFVTVENGYEVLSNGRLVGKKDNADKSVTFHWKQEQPHVAYLVTLVVGKFAIVEEEWKGKPVQYWVPPARQADAARTFGRTREMLDFFSRRFGIEYPWEKYAQVVVEQFIWGGMENTSATTLTDWTMHDARALLDSSPDGLIAHELAHQWWGNLVTCKDWAHLWLNEGFASYAEILWSEHKEGADEAAYDLWEKSRAALAGGKDRPVVDRRYPNPDSMFDARAYPKGAWVLHMLRSRLGEEAFWRAIRRYGTEHRMKTVETADLRQTFERETGRSLERFFHDWTERPGHPVVEVATEYVSESKLAKVTVKQTQAGEPFHFPLKIEFCCEPGRVSARSTEPVLKEDITERDQRFFVPLPARPQLVRIDPDHTVLAEWKETKGQDQWLAQLSEDPHVVQRIRAAQYLGQSKTPADREALATALGNEKFYGVCVQIASALSESGGEVCRDALLAGLKHEHPKVRRACADQLGKFPSDLRVAEALKEIMQKGDASYFVEADAAQSYGKLKQADGVSVLLPMLTKPSHGEAIRTAALAGLGESQDLSAFDVLVEWTKRGKPRNCRAAALKAIERLMATGNPSEEQRERAVKTVQACLEGEHPLVRRAAVETLRGVGRSASPALPTLEALARHDPDGRVREAAQKAIEQVRSNAPAPVELGRLREELERLKKANESLQERLERFEKIERK
jgi:aminopeptidase N